MALSDYHTAVSVGTPPIVCPSAAGLDCHSSEAGASVFLAFEVSSGWFQNFVFIDG